MNEIMHVVIDSVTTPQSSLIEVINSFLTPLIAVVAIFIAYRQYKNDKTRLKYELYERRILVYNSLKNFISLVIREGSNIDVMEIHKFHEETYISSFLFEKNVQEYLEEIYKKALDMWRLNKKLYPGNGIQGLPIGDKRSKISEEECNILIWITNQYKDSIEIFKRYFNIK